jgi:hypothetical protein
MAGGSLIHSSSSLWGVRSIDLAYKEMLAQQVEEQVPQTRSDRILRGKFQSAITRLCTKWQLGERNAFKGGDLLAAVLQISVQDRTVNIHR